MRDRIEHLTQYFLTHGVSDVAVAKQKAVAAIGATVHRQALILGFSDTFAVIGTVLGLAAVVLLCTRKVDLGGGGRGAH